MSLTHKLLLESPMITRQNNMVLADGKRLKGFELEKIEDNIVLFRQDASRSILHEGFTMVYFMDSEESADRMRKGELPYIILPQGNIYGTIPPFQKLFSKPDDKKRGTGIEHILGFVQGYTDDESIVIDFMKVRKDYRRNGINTQMINLLKRFRPNAKVTYEQPSPDGKAFIKSVEK